MSETHLETLDPNMLPPLIPPPTTPTRSYADPMLPLPVRIKRIIEKGRRSDAIHFVFHNGYYTVWGRTAHYVAQVCNRSLHYVNGYAVVAWLPDAHNDIVSQLKEAESVIPLSSQNI